MSTCVTNNTYSNASAIIWPWYILALVYGLALESFFKHGLKYTSSTRHSLSTGVRFRSTYIES